MPWRKLDEDGEIEGLNAGSIPVVENYVARLNGAGQGWLLSGQIQLFAGYTVEIETMFVTDFSNIKALFTPGGTAYLPQIGGVETTTYRRGGGSAAAEASVDGDISESNPYFPYDGGLHKIVFTAARDIEIGAIGYDLNNAGRNVDGALMRFVVKDELGNTLNSIPLTNKEQGATQLQEAGSVTATMIDYNETVWEKL